MLHWVKSPLSVLRSSSSSPSTAATSTKKRENNWVDGFRGIASFIVLTGHLFTSFSIYLHSPALEENGPSLLFQYPFLRLIVGGRGAVSIFFIITGYVNALGPLKSLNANNTAGCLKHMARSSFSRTGRLVFPTSVSIIFTWFMTRIGAFEMGKRIDAPWIRNGCFYDQSFWSSVYFLLQNMTVFWKTSHSHYDGVLWSVPFFLAAAFRVYTILLVMTLVSKWARYTIIGSLYLFAWITEDYFIGMCVVTGIFLAQLHIDLGARANTLIPNPVPSLLMILGLFLWSFPQYNADWAPWSRSMTEFMRLIGPQNTDIISRFYTAIGTGILMIGITFSPTAKQVLTMPLFNFLGRCSFAVYLLHNTLARSVLVWILYGRTAPSKLEDDDRGVIDLKRPSDASFVFLMPIFYAILYFLAHLWTIYIDTACVKLISKLKDLMFKDEEKPDEKSSIPINNTVPLASVAAGFQ